MATIPDVYKNGEFSLATDVSAPGTDFPDLNPWVDVSRLPPRKPDQISDALDVISKSFPFLPKSGPAAGIFPDLSLRFQGRTEVFRSWRRTDEPRVKVETIGELVRFPGASQQTTLKKLGL